MKFNILRDYIEENFGLDGDIVIENGGDFSMDLYEGGGEREFVISIGMEEEELIDPIFFCYLKDIGLNDTFYFSPAFMWAASILHEIGHCATLEYFTEEERVNSAALIKALSVWYDDVWDKEEFTEEDLQRLKDSSYAYWNVPTEYIAQRYVIETVERNPKVVWGLMGIYKKLREEINNEDND